MNNITNDNHTQLFRFDKTAAIIAGMALLFRWIHAAFIWNSDLIRIPIIDSTFYQLWASNIAAGEFVGEGIYFMSPLYPWLLGLIYSIFGVNAGIAVLVQSLLGAAAVYLVYLWVDNRIGKRYAIVSAGLAAIYAPFIFYDGALLTASLIQFLSVAILYLADRTIERPTVGALLSLGAVIGLSALARPLVLIAAPVFWWLLFMTDRSTAARRWFVTLLGIAAILLPVGIRNLIVGSELTLTTSSAGMNFYVGNNPDASGLYWEAPFLTSAEPQYEDEDYRRVASEAVGRELTTREAGSYWFRKSLDWMINSPMGYLKLLGTKAFYFWNRAEFANNVSFYLGRDVSPLLRYNPVGFWLIAPLGIAGLLVLWRRKGLRFAALALGWVAAYFAGGLIFFVSSEYRLPVTLPLLLGAAYLIVELIDLLRAKQTEAALKLSIIPLLILPLVNFRTDFIARGENSRMDWFNIANTLMKSDNAEGAIKRFERSLEVDPYFAEGMLLLAEAYYRSGKVDEAIEIGRKAGLPDPQSILKLVKGSALQEAFALLNEGNLTGAMKEFTAAGYDLAAASAETTRVSRLNAARTAFESGDLPKALEHFLAIVSTDTTREPSIYYNIAFLNFQLGRIDSAETYAMKALEIDSLNGPASSLLTRIYRSTGREAEAEDIMQRISPDSQNREAMLETVRREMDSLEALGAWEKALDAYLPYGRIYYDIAPEDKWRLGRLQYHVGNFDVALRLLGEAEAVMSSDPGLALYQGWTYRALGRFSEAEAAFQKCLAGDSQRADARISLARIYFQRGEVERSWKELDKLGDLKILDSNLEIEYKGLLDSVKAKM